MKILMTCFLPFGGDNVNASACAVEGCRAPENVDLYKLTVPVVFGEAADLVCGAIDELRPDVVICVGEAGGRKAVTPERIAINIRDARIADNKGNRPVDEKIAEDGPAGYFSTLPVKELTAAMKAAGFDAAVSDTAGTFVCNDLMYGVLHYLASSAWKDTSASGKKPLAGFIHVPADRPSLREDGTLLPVSSASADALTEALKVFAAGNAAG